MAFSTGYRTNEKNLAMKNSKEKYFKYMNKHTSYFAKDAVLNLKEVTADELAKNRDELRNEIIRTNLMRISIAIIIIFCVSITVISFF